MGVVYKARQVSLNRFVALKMIRGAADADPDEASRFRGEAEAVARLQHANIVQVFEVGEHEGRLYISLEYMEGGDLNRRTAGRPQPPAEAAALVETLARAMHHAHQRGVVHRDLKPANVLLTADGTPKIADFGLAKRLDVSGRTATGAVVGTANYMAPEQADGQKDRIGPASDVWALGAILYELLTGRPAFGADTLMQTLAQVLNKDPVPPSRLNPQTPARLEAICLRCLRKRPEQRYPSAAALADDLHAFSAARPAPPRRSRRLLWAATAASCFALALLAVAVGWRAMGVGATGPNGGTANGRDVNGGQPGHGATTAPHWEVFQIGKGDEVFDRIAFPSRQVGYAASRQAVYKTLDGGRTWAPIHAAPAVHPVFVLHFEDDQNGWMSTDCFYHTDDGGEHWSPVQLPAAKAVVRSLAFGPLGLMLAAGKDGDDLVLFRRAAAGAAWEKINPDPGSYWGGMAPDQRYRHWYPGALAILDRQVALLPLFEGSDDNGALLRSTDGGDHWVALGIGPGTTEFFDAHVGEPGGGWVAGAGGALWITQEGCTKWEDRPNPAGAPISRLAFDRRHSGFGLAPVWKGRVLLTRDGKAWSLVETDLDYATPDAAVVDPGWAFVLGSDGKVARYVDPGVPEVK